MVARADEVLRLLEAGDQAGALSRLADDLPLFQASALYEPETPAPLPGDPLRDLLRDSDPDSLTPREALELLYRLKAALDA